MSLLSKNQISVLACLFCICILIAGKPASAQDESEFATQLDSFAVYGGPTKVIDGSAGDKYTSGNEVVQTLHNNLPKIMGGLHARLLQYEIRHMNFRLQDAPGFEEDLKALAESFEIKGFNIDTKDWFSIERIVLDRLRAKPFFLIKELVYMGTDRPKTQPAVFKALQKHPF